MSCKAIGEVVVNFVAFKNRKHLTHPYVVGSRPFQRCNLFSNVFAAIGMQEEDDASPQEESGRGKASEIEDADFSVVADVGGSGGWLGKGSASVER
jgi:hypothetical protein